MELRMGEADKGREEKKKHCHGRTRKNTEKTEEETRKEAEDLPRKEGTSYRSGCVSDGWARKQKQKISNGNKTKNKWKHLPRNYTETKYIF